MEAVYVSIFVFQYGAISNCQNSEKMLIITIAVIQKIEVKKYNMFFLLEWSRNCIYLILEVIIILFYYA